MSEISLTEQAVVAHLKRLRDATVEACQLATANKAGFDEAVNWAHLICVSAENYLSYDGQGGYRVWIEEASPNAAGLQRFVREFLAGKGFSDIEVMTEW